MPRPKDSAVSRLEVEARLVRDNPVRPRVRRAAACLVLRPVRTPPGQQSRLGFQPVLLPLGHPSGQRRRAGLFRALHRPTCHRPPFHRLLYRDLFPRSFTAASLFLRMPRLVPQLVRRPRHQGACRRRKGSLTVIRPWEGCASRPPGFLVAVLASLRRIRCTVRQEGDSKTDDQCIGLLTRFDRPFLGIFAIRAS